MKQKRQLLALLLTVIFIITGCADSRNMLETPSASEKQTTDSKLETTTDDSDIPANSTGSECDYNFSLYDDGRTFTKAQISVQSDFEEFLHSLFVDEMTSTNSINVHFIMEHPENYGLEKPEPSWGDLDFTDTSETETEISNLLKELKTFDYDALTYEQQLIYDIMKEYFEDQQGTSDYIYFSSGFSPASGIQVEFPIIFSEYDFIEKSDIDNYLTLLNTCYSYTEAVCRYELDRKDKGYALSDVALSDIIDQCNEFINAEPNCLRPVFENKLKSFSGLSEGEISDYMEQFDKGIEEQLIPSYKLIITTVETIQKDNPTKEGMCNYDDGKDYYEYLVKSKTGSSRSLDELYEMINDSLEKCRKKVTKLIANNASLIEEMDSYEYFTDDPSKMLDSLLVSLKEDFPAAVNENYNINYVPESLESTMSPAYYVIPPIDNSNKNNIYINNWEEYSHMDLFPTIAHEGFPGHMYQHTYYYSQNPHYIRSLFDFTGYDEGWAKYVELCYSYKYSGMDEDLAELFKYNAEFSFGIYCACDIGINYYGWDYQDTYDYLSQYVGDDKTYVDEIYYTMVDEPSVYLAYFIGYLEIDSLKDTAMETLGSAFDIKEFHRFILQIGPCQYDIIEDRMEDWIDRAMNGN